VERGKLNPDWPWARAEVFPGRIPASSAVHSPELRVPGMMAEVEAVAVLGDG
jgi:hypothetical protein